MNNPDDLPAIRQERNLLFDFYGPMLTEKQAACFTMRFIEDCSLTEIAQELNISPQAVVDFINRAVGRLERSEKQLGLVQKFFEQQSMAQDIMAELDELECTIGSSNTAFGSDNWAEDAIASVSLIRNAISEMIRIG